MSQNVFLRRFRPYLFTRYRNPHPALPTRPFTYSAPCNHDKDVTNDYKKRIVQLAAYGQPEEWYPRLKTESDARWPIKKYREELDFLGNDETLDDGDGFTVGGANIVDGKAGSYTDERQEECTRSAPPAPSWSSWI